MTIRWLRGLGLVSAMSTAATAFASTALADPDLVSRPTPGMHVAGGNGGCTAAFAAQGNDGSYYLLTGGHCDPHDGSAWTYGEDRPLGMITASEKVGDTKDAAIIRLDPSVGAPAGDVGDRYPVRDVLSLPQIQVGMPFCKLGAVTGETCGTVKGKNGDVIEASVYSLDAPKAPSQVRKPRRRVHTPPRRPARERGRPSTRRAPSLRTRRTFLRAATSRGVVRK